MLLTPGFGQSSVFRGDERFDDDLRQRVAAIAADTGPGAWTELVDTQTMASSLDDVAGAVRLVELRGVESLYPFYGALELDEGLTYSHALLRGRGAVPMAFTRLDANSAAGRDLLDRSARLLHAAAALDDQQQLHASMRVPGRPR